MRKPHVHVDRRVHGNRHGVHDPVRIVLHSTESHDRPGNADIEGVLRFLENTPDKLGIHFVVDAEGRVGQGVPITSIAYHCKGLNTGSVGIEMIGFARFSVRRWYARRAQLKKVAKLIAFLSITYGIPITRSTVAGVCLHKDVPAGGHHDPGTGFPTRRVLRWARQIRKANV